MPSKKVDVILSVLSSFILPLTEEEVDELEDRTIALYGEWRAKARAHKRDLMQRYKEETEEEPTEKEEEENI